MWRPYAPTWRQGTGEGEGSQMMPSCKSPSHAVIKRVRHGLRILKNLA